MHSATPAATKGRQILVVAGPGRSGTSLFSGLVARLGMHMPQPEVVANKTNPRGFGEPRWAVDFHNELLKSIAVTVDDGRPEAWEIAARTAGRERARGRLEEWLEQQFAECERLVVKDPRLAWFLQLYRVTAAELGAEVRVATMLRDPAEVVRSRELAYGTRSSSTTRIAGWVNMMLAIESLTRELPRALLRYDDLLTDWQSALSRADSTLGLDLVSGASQGQLSAAGDLVDPSLHRSVIDWDELDIPAQLRDLTRRTYETLQDLVDGPPEQQGAVRGQLDTLRDEYTRYYDECDAVSRSRTTAARADERRQTARRIRQEQATSKPERPGWTALPGRVRGRLTRVLQRGHA